MLHTGTKVLNFHHKLEPIDSVSRRKGAKNRNVPLYIALEKITASAT